MTDYLADTPNLGILWCPTCQPERDPTREILETRYCLTHSPNDRGSADASVSTSGDYLSGAAASDAESDVCRAIQAVIR